MNRDDVCKPVGIFDSGLGGLSVLRALRRELPGEQFIYIADSIRSPYGEKSPKEIIRISEQITRFLINRGCKCIVVACNTATAAAIQTLRKNHTIPFIGMEPAVKTAAGASLTGRIGVLATRGTFQGNHFLNTRNRHSGKVTILEQTGDGLVELAEQGLFSGAVVEERLRTLLSPMLEAGIDQLVLGCTHYPLFAGSLRRILPEGINMIDPAPAVARQTARVLKDIKALSSCNNRQGNLYYSTGDKILLEKLAKGTGEESGVYRSLKIEELETLSTLP